MNKRQIKKLLLSQRESMVPDVLNKVLEKVSVPPAPLKSRKTYFSNKFFKAAALLSVIVILSISALIINNYYEKEMTTIYIDIDCQSSTNNFEFSTYKESIDLINNYNTATEISLSFINYRSFSDVNNSISFGLVINRKLDVIDVIEPDIANELPDLRLKGKKAETALLTILQFAIDEGYIVEGDTDNAVSIASADFDKMGGEVIGKLATKFHGFFEDKKIPCELIKESFSKDSLIDAAKNNISPGKMFLIEKILRKDPQESIEELKNLSIKELNKKYKLLERDQDKDKDKEKEKPDKH